jgi:non-heme chloroperoxidase
MPFVTVGNENGHDIQLYFEDLGSGDPVVLSQGFPLDGPAWEPQTQALLEAGHRVITFDRRGFGQSSRPTIGYDFSTFADDLEHLLEHLNLTDVDLVGFSMGTADIARYFGRHGSKKRVRKVVMLATFGPQLVASAEDPAGIPPAAFDDIQATIRKDRFSYLKNQYFPTHYRTDENLGGRVTEPVLQANFAVAAAASAYGTWACVNAWQEDFRADLPAIDVPLLILHGTHDQNIPIEFGARRIPEFLPDAEIHEIEGGPHGIGWTHPEIVNPALVKFLAR